MSKVALLIDADNISPKYAGDIIKVAKSKGNIVLSRVCGTEKHLRGWRKVKKNYPFTEVKAPTGKNSTDRVVVREATDITINFPQIDNFCLVTNDADFALPSLMLQAWKKRVIFIGNKHAAKLLKDEFDFIEISSLNKPPGKSDKIKQVPQTPKPSNSKTINDFLQLLEKAFAIINLNYISLQKLGNILKSIDPTYKVKDYGSPQLSKLLRKLPQFVELDENIVRFKR